MKQPVSRQANSAGRKLQRTQVVGNTTARNIPRLGGYAEGGYVRASDGTMVYVNRDVPTGQSRAFAQPVDLTPPSKNTDTAAKARGGKVRKVLRKGYDQGGSVQAMEDATRAALDEGKARGGKVKKLIKPKKKGLRR